MSSRSNPQIRKGDYLAYLAYDGWVILNDQAQLVSVSGQKFFKDENEVIQAMDWLNQGGEGTV